LSAAMVWIWFVSQRFISWKLDPPQSGDVEVVGP
jgi:hypothetical protein